MIPILCRVVFLVLVFWTPLVSAHKPSDSYLTLRVHDNIIEGQWDIALRDLDFAMRLDADGNGELTWDEVRSRHADIAAYVLGRLALRNGDTSCVPRATAHLVDQHTDGTYEILRFIARCQDPVHALAVDYRLFFDLDSQHKGLLRLEQDGITTTGIFSADRTQQRFSSGENGKLQQAAQYLKDGIWHIWTGADHILFLLSLLLPAVLSINAHKVAPAGTFKAAFFDVLRVVTAFTVAHSLTLTLATLGVISLPSRWVESAIALSVIVAAVNNLVNVVRDGRWIAAFFFGLIHGFGFASVLTDLGLPRSALLLALVAFNVGVEFGQLAIVAVFLPLAYWTRDTFFYRRMVFTGGSALIAAIAVVWLVERAFNLSLMPF